jgi:hypothetical protein
VTIIFILGRSEKHGRAVIGKTYCSVLLQLPTIYINKKTLVQPVRRLKFTGKAFRNLLAVTFIMLFWNLSGSWETEMKNSIDSKKPANSHKAPGILKKLLCGLFILLLGTMLWVYSTKPQDNSDDYSAYFYQMNSELQRNKIGRPVIVLDLDRVEAKAYCSIKLSHRYQISPLKRIVKICYA